MTRRRHDPKSWLLVAALGLASAVPIWGWAQDPSVQKQPESSAAPKGSRAGQPQTATGSLEGYTVGQGDILRTLFFTGELKAQSSVDISAPRIRSSFSSMITYLAPEGQQIRKGERLVEFDSSSLLSQKSEIERRVAEAKLQIERQKSDLEAQRCDLLNSVAQAEASLRRAELYGKIPKELLPANTYQQYQVNVEKAQLSLQKAKEQLVNFEASYASQMRLVQITLEQAELDLKKNDSDLALLSIAAPQDGIVIYGDNWASNRKFQVGDNVFPGMPVVTLPDLSTMQVIGYVYDTELSFLSKSMTCTFGLDAIPGADYLGTISALTSVAARKGFATQQKVFQAVIKPDKADLALMKPGMTTHVEIPMKLASGVTAVPREYIGLDDQRRYYVLKRKDAKTVAQETVELGAVGDRMAQIVSGVKQGELLLPVQSVAEVGK